MKTRIPIICLSICLLMLFQFASAQRTLIFINQTGQDIWVGAQGNPLPANGGFALPVGSQRTITVPTGSSALRFWGRTGCHFDANGNGTCETADCARGLYCGGAGGIPPATLAEFTLDASGAGYQDFYDVSLVDGYNLPMRIIPVPGTFTLPANANQYSCGIAGCTSDLNLTCPAELQVKNSSGKVISCMSACMKFQQDQYCCTGPNNTPQTCPATYYSNIFKTACPDAYSYAYDDKSSTYICSKATYQIIFGTGGTHPPPSPVTTMYKDCNYGGYAVGLAPGDYTLSQLIAKGIMNDDISSLKINGGYEVQLFQDDNFQGASIVVNTDNGCLVGNGWNDIVSSMKVRSASSSFSLTIQAENYSIMNGVQLESTTDAGGGQDVGWIDAGDWMAYNNINFPTSGSYKVEYRVASLYGSTLSLDLNAGSIQLGSVNIPATGGWQNWTTVSNTVNVNAGTYNLGIFAQTGGWNINWIRITKVSNQKTASLDNNQSLLFDFYPNPVSSELNISSASNLSGCKFSIINSIGNEVRHIDNPSEAIDVSGLTSGIYTIIAKQGDNVEIKRFVKQ